VPCDVRPADVPEDEAGPADAVAAANALRKAVSVAAAPGETVLAADTVVATGSELWGKPAGASAARATLRRLSGATHDVVGGVALVRAGEEPAVFTALTRVTFRALDDALLDWYLGSGEWRDRAGAYAIQGHGAALVRAVEGDYLNVVGLPVAALLDAWPGLLRDVRGR
jgi:septum formation protein